MVEAGCRHQGGWWVGVSSRGKRVNVTPGCCNNNPGDSAINLGEEHLREAKSGLCCGWGELEGPGSRPTGDVGRQLSTLELEEVELGMQMGVICVCA